MLRCVYLILYNVCKECVQAGGRHSSTYVGGAELYCNSRYVGLFTSSFLDQEAGKSASWHDDNIPLIVIVHEDKFISYIFTFNDSLQVPQLWLLYYFLIPVVPDFLILVIILLSLASLFMDPLSHISQEKVIHPLSVVAQVWCCCRRWPRAVLGSVTKFIFPVVFLASSPAPAARTHLPDSLIPCITFFASLYKLPPEIRGHFLLFSELCQFFSFLLYSSFASLTHILSTGWSVRFQCCFTILDHYYTIIMLPGWD